MANQFVLPSVKVLRRLILSVRRQSLKRAASSINSQLGSERKKGLQFMLESQEGNVPLWNSITDKNIYSATPEKISKVLKHIKSIREISLKDMNLRLQAANQVRQSERARHRPSVNCQSRSCFPDRVRSM